MPRRRSATAAIDALEVTLRASAPRIWRRLLVPADTPLHRLHAILQAAMLWEDYHLYAFEAGGKRYGIDEPEFLDDEPVIDARRTRLADVAPAIDAPSPTSTTSATRYHCDGGPAAR